MGRKIMGMPRDDLIIAAKTDELHQP